MRRIKLFDHITVDQARAVGQGQPFLRGVTRDTRLTLVDCKRYASGQIVVRYERAQ